MERLSKRKAPWRWQALGLAIGNATWAFILNTYYSTPAVKKQSQKGGEL